MFSRAKSSFRGIAIAVLTLAASACGGDTDAPAENLSDLRARPSGPEIEVRDEKSRRVEAEGPEGFEFVRYDVETEGDAPIACLSFTYSLNPKVDYSPYVEVAPETPLALSVSGAKLCVGGLSFGETTDLTLKEGLPGSGKKRALERDEVITVDFGDRPAYVGFRGDGVILPRIDADGVAIETVNVDALKVRVSRVTDRSLVFKSVTSGYSAARDEYFWSDGVEDPDDLAERLWEGELDISSRPNAAATTVFSMASAVSQLQPGAYYIEIAEITDAALEKQRPARAARWLIVTDLALTAYEGADGLKVTARSIDTARVARDVRLDLVARNNEILVSRKTDGFGHASFEAPLLRGEGPMGARMVMAYDERGDFAVLDLDRPSVDLSQHPVGGRDAPKIADAYLYTDRGVYRPGERIRLTALYRDSKAMALDDRAGSVAIYGPNGLEAHRERFDRAANGGAVAVDYDLPKSAARGMWRLVAEIDGVGVVGETRASVEDFVPQRVELKLAAETAQPVLMDGRRAIDASVRFLYGAPGAGLPVEGRVRVETDPRPFEAFTGYTFGLHDEAFREQEFSLDEAVADGAGRAVMMIDLRNKGIMSSKPLRLRSVISAVEPGGRAVTDDVRIPYRPQDFYLGVKADFEEAAQEGAEAGFEVVSVSVAGQSRATLANWRLVRIDWDYDWYRSDGGDWKWRRSRNVVEVDQGSVELDGEAPGKITTRALEWGDYQLLLTDENGGAQASLGFWSGWGGGPQEGVEAPDRVRISAPEKPVEIGKKATYTILPPYAGEAEIVVANEQVIETRLVSVPEKGLKVDFNVTEEWGAGAYIMVSVYTPRDPVARPRPRRAVGVAHAPVDVGGRTFELALDAPERIRPRQKLTIGVEASDGPRGELAFVTIAAVDEGILLLTKFKSPDPADWFFGKRRLSVGLKDDYGRLLDPNQGAAAQPRSGGDQIGGAGLTVVPTKSIALFSGVVPLGRNGKGEVELDIPDFNGELRLMAVAWSETGLGAVSKPLTVRDDVPAELVLPRFLAPGDEASVIATLDNVGGNAGEYTVGLTTDTLLSVGEEALNADLKAGERADLAVALKADATGVSKIDLAVSGPNGFAIGRAYDFQVRSPYLPSSDVERIRLAPDETYTPARDLLEQFVAGSGELQVSVSPLPMDAAALYDSLSRYPYGCTEQTVSRALPLLYAQDMAIIAGRSDDPEIRSRVQEAVSTLLNRQGADGAIGLWRMGDRQASPWLGAYAVDFLARAKEKGYVVPQAALNRAYQALGHVAEQSNLWNVGYDFSVYTSRWNPDTEERLAERSSAYAAFVLARAGKMDASRLRYLHDHGLKSTESPLARAHVGAALSFIGDKSRTRSAFDGAQDALGYENRGDYYQSSRRDLAGVLALAAEAGETARMDVLTEEVMKELPEPDLLSTQEKAFLLMAAHALTDGATQAHIGVAGGHEKLIDGRIYAVNATDLAGETASAFVNMGDAPVWLTAVARGAPVTAPAPVDEGLKVTKTITRADGRGLNLTRITQGDRLLVALSVKAGSRRLHPVVVADLLPAGFEIETVLTPDTAGPYAAAGDLSYASIAEARDDRFVAAIDLRDQATERFAYIVRAVTPGDFAMPGVVAEDMYRADVFGRSAGARVVIAPAR